MVENARKAPDLKKDLKNAYCVPITSCIDSLVETFNLLLPDDLIYRLEDAKKLAVTRDNHSKDKITIKIGHEELQVAPHGARGASFLLFCPDYTMSINPGRQWGVVVEYSPAGLWQYGADALRLRVKNMFFAEFFPRSGDEKKPDEEWSRLTRLDYAFDFYSEAFSVEMQSPEIFNRVVVHSSSKKFLSGSIPIEMIGRKNSIETLTLGKKGNLQVQVYNKGKEIEDKPEKAWMLKMWAREGYHPDDLTPIKNAWRLECRFFKEFLRNRGILTYDQAVKKIEEMVTEALYTRRLVTNSSSDRMRRRPLHPIWSAAIVRIGDEKNFLPIGRVITAKPEEIKQILISQAAGLLRSLAVLKTGSAEENDVIKFAAKAYETCLDDKDHALKTEKAAERYKFLHLST